MQKTAITIGPGDRGRRLSLDEFDSAEGQPGHLYELSRGVVTVVDVPHPSHFALVNAIKRQFAAYDLAHPGQIYGIASGGECKFLITDLQSERHPDVAIYKTPPPDVDNFWAIWVPEIVIEVVSRESQHRDYEEKPEEYRQFGVREYWIVNAEKQEMEVFKRSRGQWSEQTLKPPQIYKTRLLPGLEFSCALVFESASRTEN
jgi:Uma2 family endonuclease